MVENTKQLSGKEIKVYVGIEYYVDDEQPRVNDVMVFRKHKSALDWQKRAHSRDIHEAVLSP